MKILLDSIIKFLKLTSLKLPRQLVNLLQQYQSANWFLHIVGLK